MRLALIFAAAVAVSAPALADDPHDPAMRAAERARDHEGTRQLNLGEIAMIQQRDAEYAKNWHAPRGAAAQNPAVADYARQRAEYEQRLAEWRHAAAACEAGDYRYCAN